MPPHLCGWIPGMRQGNFARLGWVGTSCGLTECKLSRGLGSLPVWGNPVGQFMFSADPGLTELECHSLCIVKTLWSGSCKVASLPRDARYVMCCTSNGYFPRISINIFIKFQFVRQTDHYRNVHVCRVSMAYGEAQKILGK